MVKNKRLVKGKILKKEWHPIKSTKSFNSTPLGEGYVNSPDQLLDRQLTVNLANLTGDMRQQGTSLKFKISEVDDGVGIAGIVGYEASSSQLRRFVRKGVDRLDDSVECRTGDNFSVRVKPFAITKTSTSKYKIRLMRNFLRQELIREIRKQNYDSLIRSIIANKLQSDLKSKVKGIFPLRTLAIRKLELVEKGKPLNQSSKPSDPNKAVKEKTESQAKPEQTEKPKVESSKPEEK